MGVDESEGRDEVAGPYRTRAVVEAPADAGPTPIPAYVRDRPLSLPPTRSAYGNTPVYLATAGSIFLFGLAWVGIALFLIFAVVIATR